MLILNWFWFPLGLFFRQNVDEYYMLVIVNSPGFGGGGGGAGVAWGEKIFFS